MKEMKPYLLIEWNDTETDAIGWLCVYNYAKGSSGGGIRMHPTVTKEEVVRLAHAMAYKYQAIESVDMGGCKGGISYDYKAPDAQAVLRRYLYAVSPYISTGVSLGSDLGTNFDYILSVFKELGFTLPQTPKMSRDPKVQAAIKDFDDIQSVKWDGFLINDMITGYGVGYALDEGWTFKTGKSGGARVVIQGFGCVGASLANYLYNAGYKVVGISDAKIIASCDEGLDIPAMLADRKPFGEINEEKLGANCKVQPTSEWLSVDCDILVPAALEDVINKNNVDQVKASLIVEGANIPVTPEADEKLFARGVNVVPDFLANAGAIRYYDAIVYGYVDGKNTEAVIKDMENCLRKNVRKTFEKAKESNRYQRAVAKELFAPKIQDMPEIK